MFTVLIRLADDRAPKGKLADADLVFTHPDMKGLTLCGFSVWEGRQAGTMNVTYPSRSWTSNGERRTFALLRETDQADGPQAKRWLSTQITAAYDRALHTQGNDPRAAPAPAAAPTPATRSRR
jgi:hypothetical protein